VDVMGKWNIRCRVLGKWLRFVDVMGKLDIRCRFLEKWCIRCRVLTKRFTVCGCNGQMEY